jgi:glutathione S-transferase
VFLPREVPDFVKTLVGSVPNEFLEILGTGVGFSKETVKNAQNSLKQNLAALSAILQNRPYLVADHPTLADLAIAGLSMIVKFPSGNYLDIPSELQGKGVPGLADNSAYEPFFQWRDRLYAEFRRPLLPKNPPTGDSPTAIEIE